MMKRLLILFCFVTLWSCQQDFKGGYPYNEVIGDDSLNVEEMDSFRMDKLVKVGHRITDSLEIE